MSRIKILYGRLDELEAEMRQAVLGELRKEAEGQWSRYFSRKHPHIIDGRRYRDSATGQIESIERQILSLRRKLGEASPGPVLSLVYEFADRVDREPTPWKGERTAIARELLRKLETS